MSMTMENESFSSWWYKIDIQCEAYSNKEQYGHSTALETMVSSLYGNDILYTTESVSDWIKDKSEQMIGKIKSIVGGIKAKLDNLLVKLRLKEKQLDSEAYTTYKLSSNPDTVNSGITAGKVAITAALVLLGYFAIRTVGTTAAVQSKVWKMNRANKRANAERVKESQKELDESKEAKAVKRNFGARGDLMAKISKPYKAKRDLVMSDYQAKKAAFENKLAKERHADHARVNTYKDKAANRFSYYWTARQLKAAIKGLIALIDAVFSATTKFIGSFVAAFKQRPKGLGRVSLFQWIGRVTKDILLLLGSSIWGIIKTIGGIFTGKSKGKDKEDDQEPSSENTK